MTSFIFSLFFMYYAGIWNGAMDILVHKFEASIFSDLKNASFWNPLESWRNKWNAAALNQGVYKDRFWLSSTYLVWLTDGWHLTKSIFLFWVGLAIVLFRLPDWTFLGWHPSTLLNSLMCFFILKGAFGFGKHLAYDKGGFFLKKPIPMAT